MAAYMIVMAKIHDREKFLSGYAAATASLLEEFGGRYVLRAPGAINLEGNLPGDQSVVISEWPDTASARAFWDSAQYQEIKKLRKDICDANVVLVEAAQISPGES